MILINNLLRINAHDRMPKKTYSIIAPCISLALAFTTMMLLSSCESAKPSLANDEAIALLQETGLEFAMPTIDDTYLEDRTLAIKDLHPDDLATDEANTIYSYLIEGNEDHNARILYPFGCIATFEGAQIQASSSVVCLFEFDESSSNWALIDFTVSNSKAQPIGGVPDATLEKATESFIAYIDSNDLTHDEQLSNLYGHNRIQSIIKNTYSQTDYDNNIDFTIQISAKKGVAKYTGNIIGRLTWESTANSNGSTNCGWKLVQATANDDAYNADFSDLVGTWIGTRVGPDATDSQGKCLGGASDPPTLTVNSVDSKSRTMQVNLEFLAHNHKSNDNVQNTTEGDSIELLPNATFPIETNSEYVAYTYRYDTYDRKKYEVRIGLDENTISMNITFIHIIEPAAFSTYSYTFEDEYTFSKESSN